MLSETGPRYPNIIHLTKHSPLGLHLPSTSGAVCCNKRGSLAPSTDGVDEVMMEDADSAPVQSGGPKDDSLSELGQLALATEVNVQHRWLLNCLLRWHGLPKNNIDRSCGTISHHFELIRLYPSIIETLKNTHTQFY